MRLRPPAAGAAGKRVALVVGNNLYPQSPLKNAVGDALLMANVLREIGFTVEPPLLNATALEIERAMRAFAGKLEGSDVGLFYYAGHGIAVEGKNYLLGVDFSAEDELEARRKAVEADLIADRMDQGGARLNLIVLDACRNNPFKLGKRAEGVGLGTMEAGRGMLIAMATAPGKAASDNPTGTNGLFTKFLAEDIKEPGLGVKAVFDRVKAQVIEASGGQQRPWVHDDVVGDVTLVPAAEVPIPEVAGPVDRSQMELAFWNSIKDSRDPRDFEGYLEQVARGAFGGTFQRLAENRLADTRPKTATTSAPAPVPPPSSQGSTDDRSGAVTPDTTAKAPPPVESARPVGYLDLTGPANTRIVIDGKEIGRLPFAEVPLEDALFLTEGEHEIKILYPGYQPLVHTVTIRAGETTSLFVDLGLDRVDPSRSPASPPPSPAKADFSVSAVAGDFDLSVFPPEEVRVVINAREPGSPLSAKPLALPAGTHTVTIHHPAFEPLTRTFTIRAGEITRLSINLRQEARAK